MYETLLSYRIKLTVHLFIFDNILPYYLSQDKVFFLSLEALFYVKFIYKVFSSTQIPVAHSTTNILNSFMTVFAAFILFHTRIFSGLKLLHSFSVNI